MADPASGQVVAAHGTTATSGSPPSVTDGPPGLSGPAGRVPDGVAAVLGWAGAEAATEGTGTRFEDAVITTGETYHLVRTLDRDDAPLFAYLQVDRVRGNLALARRALLALPSGPVAVPARSAAPEAERIPPVAVPLPRRAPAPASPPAAAAPASEPPGRPGSRWSDDLRTMARILAGLRRLDRGSATES